MKKQNLLIKENQIYQLGNHILVCGDCTNSELVKKAFSGLKIVLILTDPPYGVSYVESKNSLGIIATSNIEIKNDNIESEDQYYSFTKAWLTPVIALLEKPNSFYIFNCDKMLFAMHRALVDLEFNFSQLLIWVKSSSVLGRKDYMPQHELIAYGWCGKHKFHKSKDRSILFEPKPAKSKLHPTMKPISLLRRLILNSSKIGDVIYDPFGGSGSTLIACEHTQRKCVMIELDTKHCETIIARYKKLTGTDAILTGEHNA